ncbi:MAG: trypsin-like peptidase domain-containing protein [Oscillospiraceae bacterium]|nr:trypsin-like peptidase domain-containing protein [Oscillospiraceae bacterium]
MDYNDYQNYVDSMENGGKNKKGMTMGKITAACISSALAASICTGAMFSFVLKANNNDGGDTGGNNAGIGTQMQTQDTGGDDMGLTQMSNNFGKKVLTAAQIAEKVGPSVVGVINKAKVEPKRFYDPFSGRYYYYQDPSTEGNVVEQGSGSGIIISSDGYIVTNNHVIEGATEVTVILNDGTELAAEIVGADEKTDLAVLKVAGTDMPAAVLGDSTTAKAGELAVAIGNPLGQELAGSVTAGVVSAVNRKLNIGSKSLTLIQTDAAINPGNSGGALVNQYGEVIGINTVKLSTSGVEGLGFAIAISEAKPIIDNLKSNGYVSGRPLVGISVSNTNYGLSVAEVAKGGAAEKAGIKVGDLIIKADGTAVKNRDVLNEMRDAKKPGDTMVLTVMRDGELIDITVVLGEEQKPEN